MATIAPVTVLLVLHHLKRKAKKKIRKAVKAKVGEWIDDKRHYSADFERTTNHKLREVSRMLRETSYDRNSAEGILAKL